jgi:multicomponent Na+:H+ antiporter subunit F
MSTFLLGVALFLVLTVGAGLVRVALGPTQGDRMVATQLFGTTGVAILLVLAQAMAQPSLRDVALVFALLAVVLSVSFVKRGWVRRYVPGEVEHDTLGGTHGD